MPQQITVSVKDMVQQAKAEIDEVDVAGARELIEKHGATLVDIRDIRELWRDGKVPGSRHVPRGMLEFWIDPDSPYYKDFFAGDGPFVFMCAGGFRSALATQVAQRMGLKPVYNLIGGFGAWSKNGAPVEPHERK
jgi:rhodanese-related sulfurtransferase